MNDKPGVKFYGKERVCTGPHVWEKPKDGYVICQLCYVIIPVTDPRYTPPLYPQAPPKFKGFDHE